MHSYCLPVLLFSLLSFPSLPHMLATNTTPPMIHRCANCYQHESQTFSPLFFFRERELLLASFMSINTWIIPVFTASNRLVCRCVSVCYASTARENIIPEPGRQGCFELHTGLTSNLDFSIKVNFHPIRKAGKLLNYINYKIISLKTQNWVPWM